MSSFYAAENTAVCMSLVLRGVATETRRFTDGYRQIQTNTDKHSPASGHAGGGLCSIAALTSTKPSSAWDTPVSESAYSE